MITVHAIRNVDGDRNFEYDFKGLSTDTKPNEWGGKAIEQNSLFLELDTGEFFYCKSTFVKGEGMETLANGTISEWGEDNGMYFGELGGGMPYTLPDNIVVVWDGTEYQCVKTLNEVDDYYYYGTDFGNPDFSTYPFSLFNDGGWFFACNSNATRTYEIKAEVQDTPAVWRRVGGNELGTLIFNETVEGASMDNAYITSVDDLALNYPSLVVDYNGTKYTVNNISMYDNSWVFGATAQGGGYDFTTYPFQLVCAFEFGTISSTIYASDSEATIKIWTDNDPIDPTE